MKKINLYMLLIFIAALTGCDDNVNDHFALPQTNPQAVSYTHLTLPTNSLV